ncbi:MAG TPA: hypothetical protein VEC16_05715, partial [Alphaproteobacteria bacterium]|nr:hypothetical protein [Alphaproteobacteria bacterium]
MNKTLLLGISIFAALIISLLAASMGGVNAQSIITGNSNSNISIVSYDIDVAPLGLSDYFETNYYNDTNTTIITNTTNTVEYTCTLNVDGNSYVRNGLAPSLVHYEAINESLIAVLDEGIYTANLNCSYYINITTIITNTTNNNTVVDTLLFLNTTLIDTGKIIVVDYTVPSILLNETNITIYNTTNLTDSSSIDLTIIDISQMACS